MSKSKKIRPVNGSSTTGMPSGKGRGNNSPKVKVQKTIR